MTDDDFALVRARLDLSKMAPRRIDLFGDQRRALRTSASFARRHLAASVDVDGRPRGINIGPQQKCRKRVS